MHPKACSHQDAIKIKLLTNKYHGQDDSLRSYNMQKVKTANLHQTRDLN